MARPRRTDTNPEPEEATPDEASAAPTEESPRRLRVRPTAAVLSAAGLTTLDGDARVLYFEVLHRLLSESNDAGGPYPTARNMLCERAARGYTEAVRLEAHPLATPRAKAAANAQFLEAIRLLFSVSPKAEGGRDGAYREVGQRVVNELTDAFAYSLEDAIEDGVITEEFAESLYEQMASIANDRFLP